MLDATGYAALVHENAPSALANARLAGTQVFILDIGMPAMNGYALARRLRANPATHCAVLIALTGYGQEHDQVLSRAVGFDHHFVKPVDINRLTEILAKLDA